MEKNALLEAIAQLANKSEINLVPELTPLSGGGNNRLYQVHSATSQDYVVKHYFVHSNDQRDRLKTEFSFLSYAWKKGLRSIPQPYDMDRENSLALYEFIQGRKLEKEEIGERAIEQCLELIVSLNQARQSDPSAKQLQDASESCFSLEKHIQTVERRLKRLTNLPSLETIDIEAKNFVQTQLLPTFGIIREQICAGAKQALLPLQKEIDISERVLSPSDFGFHNALMNEQGVLRFIDFEYAGWDDPAKLICDFFGQPEIPVSIDFFPIFLARIQKIVDDSFLSLRVRLLSPLYRIKWCCIMLNVFLQADGERRFFATNVNREQQKQKQLNRVLSYFNCYFNKKEQSNGL